MEPAGKTPDISEPKPEEILVDKAPVMAGEGRRRFVHFRLLPNQVSCKFSGKKCLGRNVFVFEYIAICRATNTPREYSLPNALSPMHNEPQIFLLNDVVHGGQEITNSKILSHVILLSTFVKYVSFFKGHRLFLNKNCEDHWIYCLASVF